MKYQKGQSGNPLGRPRGSKNKVNAEKEVSKALATGMSLPELSKFLTDKVRDPNISDTQRDKYLKMLLDFKKDLTAIEMRKQVAETKANTAQFEKESKQKAKLDEIKQSRPIVNNVAKFDRKAKPA